MVEAVRGYFENCPYILGTVNINCLGESFPSYSIDTLPADTVIKKYCDGGSLCQLKFNLSLRDAYDENVAENSRVSEELEAISSWVYAKNLQKELPICTDEGIEVFSLEITSGAYLVESTVDSARWQMGLRLLYKVSR